MTTVIPIKGQAYVVGFAFDYLRRVWLIRKNRPEWQAGKLNGIGGKIEPNETSIEAMSREFMEEAGVLVPIKRWRLFHRETWLSGNSVDFFVTELRHDQRPIERTDEKLVCLGWRQLTQWEWADINVMYNLPYLVPMAYIYLYEDPANLPYHKGQNT